jgi:tRNA threonylcarbamoyladenosine biosynthesis protein TsaE
MEITFGQQELAQIARKVIEAANPRVLAFYGAMGTGKTTIIKAILTELGADDAGNSPTFGIVNEYHDTSGQLLAFHFDIYRLNNSVEALDLGFEEYLDKHCWIFMEWPEKIQDLLPESYARIRIEALGSGMRRLTLENLPR